MTPLTKNFLFGTMALMFFLVGCSDCGNRAAGTKTGEPLKWESIPLGSDETSFKKSLATLVQLDLETIETYTKCGDQIGIAVPDIDDLVILERSRGDHLLSNCFFQTKRTRSPSPLIDIRGEFLDNKLIRLTYRLGASECLELEATLGTRFGAGLSADFLEKFLLSEQKQRYRVWQFDDIVWSLTSGEADTCLLTQQNLDKLEELPKPTPPKEKIEPVSLEDLGIGELNLKEPEPIEELKDASVL